MTESSIESTEWPVHGSFLKHWYRVVRRPNVRHLRSVLIIFVGTSLIFAILSLPSSTYITHLGGPISNFSNHTGPVSDKAQENLPGPSNGGSQSAPELRLLSNNDEVLAEVAGHVDWTQFAYVQYVTNYEYLCNSLMLFERLSRLGCHASRLMMYPDSFDSEDVDSKEGRLLALAHNTYNVTLRPIHVQSRAQADATWRDSYTKLLAMNQTQYRRVLSLDSDSTILRCMDELFLLPEAPVAMPRAYWLWRESKELSSQLLLLMTNATEFERVMERVENADTNEFDMDILNNLYLDSAMIIPHRPYTLLSGEFKTSKGTKKDHSQYLGSLEAVWDPAAMFKEAKFLHFSDWPIPKPWLSIGAETLSKNGPECLEDDNCQDKEIWMRIYGDFKRRRREICGIEVGGVIEEYASPL